MSITWWCHVDLCWLSSNLAAHIRLCRMWTQHWPACVRPSREVSGHFMENAWKEIFQMCYADVSSQYAEIIWFWSLSVYVPTLGRSFDLAKWIRFRVSGLFFTKFVDEMAWNVICWCIPFTSSNDLILVTICWFSYIYSNFGFVKRVKSVFFGNFLGNT